MINLYNQDCFEYIKTLEDNSVDAIITDPPYGYGNDNGDNLGERIANVKRQNNHPTVKPTKLMEHLIKLITPPNGVVLDPFMGSGSTGKALVRINNTNPRYNLKFIGVELSEDYVKIAEARIKFENTRKHFKNTYNKMEKDEQNEKD